MAKTVKKLKLDITIDNEQNTIQWVGWHSYNGWLYWRVHGTNFTDFRILIDKLHEKLNVMKKECLK